MKWLWLSLLVTVQLKEQLGFHEAAIFRVVSQTEGSVQNYGYCADLDSCKKQLHNPDKNREESLHPFLKTIFTRI